MKINQIKVFVFLLAAALLTGCSKEKTKQEYIARVNDTYLTPDEFSRMAGSGSYSKLYKDELIRRWIKREVLYQEALDDGLIDDPEFKYLVENSKKELASSMMLNKYFEDEALTFEPKDIESYFNQNEDKFRLFYDTFLINIISFNDEDHAISFRSMAVESDWDKAVNVFKIDSTLTKLESKKLMYGQDVHPVILLRMINELYPGEISIVLQPEPGNYTIVQLVEKFDKGTIPPFETIKDRVEKVFIAEKKAEVLDDYLDELFSEYEIEVKNR